MTLEKFPIEIPEEERTPLVNWLLDLVAEQQQIIEKQQQTIAKLEAKVNSLDEELKAAKKLKAKPKISPSTLNSEKKNSKKSGKRPGSDKRSKKLDFVVDEERIIEPEEELPDGTTFNGYREYDVQDLIIKRHNIRFLRFRIRHSRGKNNSREVTSENTLDITDRPSSHLLSINIISVECPRI
ncbi:MAG: hypothetical protein QNJ65_16570 [Xenococcaceae cyanobacterium MO_234.B1]|nr:hypothetical protein [Xenococcaceae cyanobacterium MO_234.B1]